MTDSLTLDKQETKIVNAIEEVEAEDEEEAEPAVAEDAAEQMDVDGNDVVDTALVAAAAVSSEGDADSTKMDVCPAGRATYIHRTIMMKILPQLQKCLIEKVRGTGGSQGRGKDRRQTNLCGAIYLLVCLSVSVFLYFCVYLSLDLPVYLCPSSCSSLSVFLLYICICLRIFLCLSVCLSVFLSVWRSV